MSEQPKQSKKIRSIRTLSALAKGIEGRMIAGAVLVASPFPADAFAMAPGDAYPVFTVILAVLAGILGLSASLLYRHMHQRVEDLRHRGDNAEAELRALLMLTDEAVLILAFDGTVRAANPASEEVFNRDADQIVGEPLTAVIAQPLALSELTKHGPVNFQTTAKRGKDDFAQVEMLLSPVEMTTGKGYLAVVHRTSEIFPEDPVKRTKRKDDVQGAIEKFTHDLNNQLTSVLGHLSLALMARPGDPATHQRVLDAKKTAIRAQSLSAEMQAFIHPDHDEPHSTATTTAMPDMNCTILPMPIMTPPAKLSSDRKPGPTRLLILDDEEAICMLVSSVLGASGFEVTSAYSVATALQATQDAMEAGTPFSLAICDLSLPGDTDGVQALKQLQAIDPSLKAIVSSGYDSDAVMRDCRKFGFCASMSKPYDIGRLMRIVSQVLAGDGVPLLKTA